MQSYKMATPTTAHKHVEIVSGIAQSMRHKQEMCGMRHSDRAEDGKEKCTLQAT